MFDPNSTHHRCRNLRCKTQLQDPVEHPRNAFSKFWKAAALIGPNDPLVNILGGYKFPGTSKVDPDPAESPIPIDRQIRIHTIAQIPADLSIPPCLRRVAS